ncbi:protein phosphatase 1 regulatory subunit 11 [Elysia marginata]|uniref:E3 ubiquitin-protein ligase PPP1R11 n=1 Tax=Elysia marginata TaxID=1093978 RepID=A0AAV4FT07_9GAST|nr:protein phosphatase 1 regulatory subunit 11 [Elysia marginata]
MLLLKLSPPVLTLRLHQPDRQDHRVKWTSDTVDNEFMGKKKSKCCCIYEKPKVFGESDTSSDDEEDDHGCTPHCRGHKKKCYRHHKQGHHHHDDDSGHDHDHNGGRDDDNMAGPSNLGCQTTVCGYDRQKEESSPLQNGCEPPNS